MRFLLFFFYGFAEVAAAGFPHSGIGYAQARGVMVAGIGGYVFLVLAGAPFIYYLLVLYSTVRFFKGAQGRLAPDSGFTPPVSNLKPLRGLDPESYENLASYCRQDYPDYELIFCVGEESDPSVTVLEQLKRDFPERQIRILIGSGRNAINDKVAKLVRMVQEARHEVLVINDSDVRVQPDYLRSVVAPLRHAHVGGVTTLYVSTHDNNFTEHLQSIGMISDFFPAIFVARELDGIKFAFGQTIVTTKTRLQAFGGYESIENRPADDLLVGRYIAQQGCEVELLPYAVKTVPDYHSFEELFIKRLRWLTVMRHMRPLGHFGLLFTQGLPWCLAVFLVHPRDGIGALYLGLYLFFRAVITSLVGVWGLKQSGIWKSMPLFVVWDATAFVIWLLTIGRRSIRWRNVDYRIRDGKLVPLKPGAPQNSSPQALGSALDRKP
jgi:ceramide glucosyltransferase